MEIQELVGETRVYRQQKLAKSYTLFVKWLCFSMLLCGAVSNAQVNDSLTASKLKKLSLEELLNLEVTSVSKHLEKLVNAASAIQVITGADIQNSGATSLADALKLGQIFNQHK